MHQEGDTVRCVSARGYVLTTGKEYKVLEVVPQTYMENGFTFPYYVAVRDDLGRLVLCHHHRFQPVPKE